MNVFYFDYPTSTDFTKIDIAAIKTFLGSDFFVVRNLTCYHHLNNCDLALKIELTVNFQS